MKLYIAEKPSLGRAIAEVLPKPHTKGDGFIRVGNGDCVSWCIGHLLEQAEPEAYDPAFKSWKLEHLPITPRQWQLQPKPKTRKQLGVLRKLVKEADQIVHAGDPDREGQLLVDQVIDFLGVKGARRDGVERCLISDLNPSAVTRALQQLRSNKDFVPLSTSALARSRADWLYGINMTRATTLQGRKVGFDGLLSVGRVQTPVLGLVVRRDREIGAFVSKPFYQVLAHVQTPEGVGFTAKWQPSEACESYQDEEGRVLSRSLAKNVVSRITDKPANVTSVQAKEKSQPPPLPFNLSSLQIDAAKRFGMSAKQVLDTCQALYERHKLITYPRSDSRYLPAEHWQQGPSVIAAIAANCDKLTGFAQQADPSLKSKAWNDSKVDAHHAIIPTMKASSGGLAQRLGKHELQVYELIARQYLCQFYSRFEFTDTRVELCIEGGVFVAKARQLRSQGWKQMFPVKKSGKQGGEGDDRDEDTLQELPPLKKGDNLHCLRGELLEKQTQPTKAFTDATLLAAMTGISRFVSDPEIRKVLKETDGLGTEATRAGILELLFKRGYLSRQGKQIKATPAGCGLIDSLPAAASTPDMTAQWESVLEAISERRANYQSFMSPLLDSLRGLIAQSKAVLPEAMKGLKGVKGGRSSFKKRGYKKTSASKSQKSRGTHPA